MTDLRADLPDDIVALLREADGADVVSAATRRAAWTQIEGRMARAISQGTGIAPTLERRYGLNPAMGAVR